MNFFHHKDLGNHLLQLCSKVVKHLYMLKFGVHGGAVGWSTALQAGRSRVRFPMVSPNFFIDTFLPAALRPWGWLLVGLRFSAPVQTSPGAHPASYTMGTMSFPRDTAAGAWRWPSTPSSTEVEGRVKLYICFPSGPLWPVLGWILPLPL
jgi:hypothetical protein